MYKRKSEYLTLRALNNRVMVNPRKKGAYNIKRYNNTF